MSDLESIVRQLSNEQVMEIAGASYLVKNCSFVATDETAKMNLLLQKDDAVISIFVDVRKFRKG